MALLLKASDLAPLLGMAKAVALTEEVLLEQSRGQVEVHAPFHLHVPGGALRCVSSALPESGIMGLRFGPALALTPPSGARCHIAALYRTDGELLAVMGYPFSTLRTGATVAVAVKHMAPPDAKRVGLIGTGNNALSLLEGLKVVRDIAEVAIYSRKEERRENFAADAEAMLGIPVRPVEEARDAVSGKDIVLTATNFRQPLFPVEWLDAGCHVNSMGPIGELPADLFLTADHVVVSCIDHEKNYIYPTPPYPLVELIRDGKMEWDDVDELGAVVAGKAKVRKGTGGVTVFHESAGGFGDVVFAGWAYEEARRLGLGQEMSFD